MVTGHFHMELTDCAGKGNISELFVHIVDTSSGLISENDSIGFDMVGSAFENLIDGENLSLSRLGLELSSEMVPKFGFGNNLVGGK